MAHATISSLPTEILEDVLSYIDDPIDLRCIRLSCRRMAIEIPLYRVRNCTSWGHVLTHTPKEDPDANELLCTVCQRKHHRSVYPYHRMPSVPQRWCCCKDAAIELGPWRIYPKEIRNITCGMIFRSVKVRRFPDLYLRGYSIVNRKLEEHDGQVLLFADLNIEAHKMGLRPGTRKHISSKQTKYQAVQRVKRQLKSLQAGGEDLYLCPHIPAVSWRFCTELWAFLGDGRDHRFGCGVCDTAFKFHRKRCSTIKISITRNLGLSKMMPGSPDGLDDMIKHLSTRISQARSRILEESSGRDASSVCHLHDSDNWPPGYY